MTKRGRWGSTMSAAAIKPALSAHLERLRQLEQRDWQRGLGHVYFPDAFDRKAPFSEKNLERIRDLKKIYHLDFDSRASHRLRETKPPRKSKAKP